MCVTLALFINIDLTEYLIKNLFYLKNIEILFCARKIEIYLSAKGMQVSSLEIKQTVCMLFLIISNNMTWGKLAIKLISRSRGKIRESPRAKPEDFYKSSRGKGEI